MDKEQLAKLIAEKIDAAYKASEHPKKFFITENGRGVVDGGDLYNAVLKDVLGVVTVAVTDIFQALMAASAAPAEKPAEKLAKVSTKK
ncbi:MAG: hypothetical protein IKN16_02950 [Selenomonadaceae bacterium]|nr:hypothetical protein [Selenomonadaceae bacterium]